MIRKAVKEDIPKVAAIYDEILSQEEAGACTIGWQRGVYPTRQTAQDALEKGTLFVCEAEGEVVAAAKIDQQQVDVYAQCPWKYEAPEHQVMVLHTLVVSPQKGGQGYGKEFVAFYEAYAQEMGCTTLRMDTNEKNTAARAMYQKLGYREAAILPCRFNGIAGVNLVCLEKKLPCEK